VSERQNENATATRVGMAEAEVADLELRLKESLQREQRLIEASKASTDKASTDTRDSLGPIGSAGETRTAIGALAGEIEAEIADLKLRLRESQEREKRLVERVFLAEERLEDALSTEHELRIQIHRYAEFNRDVKRSRPWRMIQFLRRLVGREW
jgi:hypothetical protein